MLHYIIAVGVKRIGGGASKEVRDAGSGGRVAVVGRAGGSGKVTPVGSVKPVVKVVGINPKNGAIVE